MKLVLGAKVKVEEVVDYDHSMSISVNGKSLGFISETVAKNLYIKL